MSAMTVTSADWAALAERLHPSSRTPEALTQVFAGLQRPECVLTHASGALLTSDARGGVMRLQAGMDNALSHTSDLVPNGIALMSDGSFLVANLSPEGGVWRLSKDGAIEPWLMAVEGRALGRVNFIMLDDLARVWVCVSAADGGDHYPLDTATGWLSVVDSDGARIVAEGLHYTNECRVSADGRYLYVNETFGRCTSRFDLSDRLVLSRKQVVAQFSDGDFPDGLTLDAEGGVWVVCVGSNRLYRIGPEGERIAVIDDAVDSTCAQLEHAFATRTLTRPMISAARGQRLPNITSLAFGGDDLRTAYMGCLAGDSISTFCSPVAGLRPVHWHWPL